MKPFLRKRAQQMRAAGADHALRSRRGRARAPARRRLGAGMAQLDRVQQRRHRRADRGPVRLLLVARAGERLRAKRRAAPRRAAPAARSGAAAGAAPDCRAPSGRIWPDAGRRRGLAAGDRRRHRATGRPFGRSARGRRHRRMSENPWSSSEFRRASVNLQCKSGRSPPTWQAGKSLENYTKARENANVTRHHIRPRSGTMLVLSV